MSVSLEDRCFAPWLNTLLRAWQKSSLPGKYKLYSYLKSNLPKKVILYDIAGREFVVPVDEWCFWHENGPENYYLDEFIPFCEQLNKLNTPFTLFDLGADIGTVSSLVAKHCPQLSQIIAFEPNESSFQLLEKNLKAISSLNLCINQAVSNYAGTARLMLDENKTVDHEGAIDPSQPGNTKVTSLDTWLEENNKIDVKNVVLKIDVEGQERATIEGATKLISNCNTVVILLELHPDVLKQSGETPEVLFTAAEKTRPFKWFVPSLGNQPVSRDKPFFETYPTKQYDIIGIAS